MLSFAKCVQFWRLKATTIQNATERRNMSSQELVRKMSITDTFYIRNSREKKGER